MHRLTALAVACATLAPSVAAQDRWLPIDVLELDPIVGVTPTSSGMTYVAWRDTLVLTTDNASGEFAEITPDGTLVGFFDWSPPPTVTLDNGGLAADPFGERLFYVNGLTPTTTETVEEFDADGTDTTVTPSDVAEAGALARNPATGELYVYDILGRQLRRMSLVTGSYVTTVGAPLSPDIFGTGDAGLAYNPLNGRLAAAGEQAAEDGRVFDIDFNGTVVGLMVDTGITAGISALTFDGPADRMFVRTRLEGRRIHVYRRSPQFTNLANALLGTNGEPQLVVASALEAGDPIEVELTSAREDTPAALIVGFSAVNAPAKSGVLVPALDVTLSPLTTDALGDFSLLTTWPPGVPSGLDLYLQFWLPDPNAPLGFAASNAVTGSVP